jgi:hypothetical protein
MGIALSKLWERLFSGKNYKIIILGAMSMRLLPSCMLCRHPAIATRAAAWRRRRWRQCREQPASDLCARAVCARAHVRVRMCACVRTA